MKTKKHWIAFALVVTFMLSTAATEAAGLIPTADEAKKKASAPENSPIIERGVGGAWSLTPPGLEKIVFVHYKKGFAKPPWAGGGKKEPQCYDFLGRGVAWGEFPISYVIHPDVEALVPGAVFASAETWDSATSQELFSDSYTLDATADWDSDAPDGRNELVFDNYPEEGVIGVAIVWGYFTGPPQSRRIVEFDILFDTDFAWGNAAVDPMMMDLQNIATHELGHGVGMGDIYDTVCSEVTMYGYSDYGETTKRTLEPPDITGIQKLYGE